MRNLVLVLGDQLDHSSPAFEGFDSQTDALWMAEVEEELVHVWCHKLRIAFFLSAMRHFRDSRTKSGTVVHYHEIGKRQSDDVGSNFCSVLSQDVRRLKPERLIAVEPGDYRVKTALKVIEHRILIQHGPIVVDIHVLDEPAIGKK